MIKAVKPRRQLTRRESLTFGALLLPLNVFFKLYYADQEKDERKNKWQKSSRRSESFLYTNYFKTFFKNSLARSLVGWLKNSSGAPVS